MDKVTKLIAAVRPLELDDPLRLEVEQEIIRLLGFQALNVEYPEYDRVVSVRRDDPTSLVSYDGGPRTADRDYMDGLYQQTVIS